MCTHKARSPKGRPSGLDLQRCFDESIPSLVLLKGQELGFRPLKGEVSCPTDVPPSLIRQNRSVSSKAQPYNRV